MRSATRNRKIPSLDGLRAFSILLVLYGHGVGTSSFPIRGGAVFAGEMAHLGVQTFFVISGFLISSLLKEELSIGAAAHISLRNFYLRRSLRIFPAFYAYLLIVASGMAFGAVQVRTTDFLHAFSYTINYVSNPSWYVGHIWSLSTEEQFYILWPSLIVLISWRRAIIFAAIASIFPMLRFLILHQLPSANSWLWGVYPNGIDTIAAGCFFAGIRPFLDRSIRYQWFIRSYLGWLVVLPLLMSVIVANHARLHFVVAFLVNPSLVLFVDRCIRMSDGAFGKFLNCSSMCYLGVLSYSVYLWQQPFLDKTSTSVLSVFPLNLLCIVVSALLSFHLIEQPALRLRRRIERRTGDCSGQVSQFAPIPASKVAP
jgi:peptidoglycan/LPS O-acetylase OafA/YrhL